MCEPMSITAGVMAAASVAMSMAANSEKQSARSSAMNAEHVRQQGIQQKSQALFDTTLNTADKPTTDANTQAAADTRRNEDVARLQASPTMAPGESGNAPQEVGSTMARSMRNALNKNVQRAGLAADVGAYGDARRDLGVGLSRAGQWQSIFGNQAQGSAAILPYELQSANNAGSGLAGLGQLVGAGGRALGGFGATGGGGSWADLFGSSMTKTGLTTQPSYYNV